MSYSFDQPADRTNTDSYKWDTANELYGQTDLIPMWVADMDFECPPEVVAAIRKRAEHPIYGYTVRPDSYREAIVNWIRKRYHWDVDPKWLAFCPPGVIQGVQFLIHSLTAPGDSILTHVPAYEPSLDVVRQNQRKLIEVPLRLDQGRYTLTAQDLEDHLTPDTHMLLLCNPHNPTGRVWTREELDELGRFCRRHDLVVVSDDIHADIVYPGHRYRPLASVSPDYADHVVTLIAPSKSFNLGGLQTSTAIIPNDRIRQAFNQELAKAQTRLDTIFGQVAVEAAYTHGEPWLEAVTDYIQGNRDYLIEFFKQKIPTIKVIEPEGTFLVWLDCRQMELTPAELNAFFVKEAGVMLSPGEEFGVAGHGFARINIACTRALLKKGLDRIQKAVADR